MATQAELAVFAYNAYRPRSPGNFIDLSAWIVDANLSLPNRGAGFDGSVFFKKGSPTAPEEIVIAFRGTDGPNVVDWTMNNLPAFSFRMQAMER